MSAIRWTRPSAGTVYDRDGRWCIYREEWVDDDGKRRRGWTLDALTPRRIAEWAGTYRTLRAAKAEAEARRAAHNVNDGGLSK